MTEGRTIAIGDVHGCSAALAALWSGSSPRRLNEQRHPDDDQPDMDVDEKLMPLQAAG